MTLAITEIMYEETTGMIFHTMSKLLTKNVKQDICTTKTLRISNLMTEIKKLWDIIPGLWVAIQALEAHILALHQKSTNAMELGPVSNM